AWISWGRAVGLREVIPAAGINSPAGAVTLSLASTVGVLLAVLVALVMWTTGNSNPRWREVMKALFKPVEPARVGRDNIDGSGPSVEEPQSNPFHYEPQA
ncbi:hypothetical protein, partial [Streptomyces toyocaensis]